MARASLGRPAHGLGGREPLISEQRALAFLGRPMHRVYRRTNEGRLVSPRYLDPTVVDELRAVHE